MRPNYYISTQPQIEPVSLEEVTQHVRVDSSEDYDYLSDLIPVAREYIDSLTCRSSATTGWLLIAETWQDLFNDTHANHAEYIDPIYGLINRAKPLTIPLYRYPLSSVESVKYYPADGGALTTLSTNEYRVITTLDVGVIQLINPEPALADRPDAIQITFTAGSLPASAVNRHAIKMFVCHLYEQRAPISFGSEGKEIPFTISALLTNLKSSGYF
jgi:hypothetical protein